MMRQLTKNEAVSIFLYSYCFFVPNEILPRLWPTDFLSLYPLKKVLCKFNNLYFDLFDLFL